MAGHSQYKNIMHKKGREDAKRGKLFNKLAREIAVAAKQGMPDPASNPRLRAAIADARKNSLPRDRIERAIKSAMPGSSEGTNYEEVRYEGYGPGGCALIMEALTDNRNRTAAEIRASLSKLGGNLGETGSVGFMFNHVGEITFLAKVASADNMLEAVIDAGGDNVESDNEQHVVNTTVETFGSVRHVLEAKYGEAESAKLVWKSLTPAQVTGDDASMLVKLLDVLDDNDDIQNVYGNFDISEEDMAKLAG
jgi:YebC/PmpR family DNA-binding regulatory protein